jgi:hypothetical protein
VLVGFSTLCGCSGQSAQDAGAGTGAADASATVCDYLSQFHVLGEEFPSSDGCNTCQCLEGGRVTCGTRNCWADGGASPCTPGVDLTCNEDPFLFTLLGQCLPNGVCDCGTQHVTSPLTGRCLISLWNHSGSGCEYGGTTHDLNSSFPCIGSCDVCRCDSPGVESATHVTCDPAAGVVPCTYDAQYLFGDVGGPVPSQDRTTLGTIYGYSHLRTRADGSAYRCSPTVEPACADPVLIDISDVMLAIMDPSVQEALAHQPSPALFGVDTRAQGTPVFSVQRSNSGELVVGAPCAGAAGCVEPPAGVTVLVNTLKALDAQALNSIDCDAAPTPGTFVCDNLTCQLGTEYCALGSQNGRRLVAACRPFPAGCSSCECAKADAEPVLAPVLCAPVSGYHCVPGDDTLPDAGSVGLIIMCSGA